MEREIRNLDPDPDFVKYEIWTLTLISEKHRLENEKTFAVDDEVDEVYFLSIPCNARRESSSGES